MIKDRFLLQAVFSYFMNRLKGLLLYFFDPKLLKEANENHTINTGKRTLSERSSSSASSEVRNSGIQADSATTKYAENLADVVLSNVLSNTSIRDSSTSFSLYKVMQLAENVINDIISDIEKNNVSSKGKNLHAVYHNNFNTLAYVFVPQRTRFYNF